MIKYIENEYLKVGINSIGAELCILQSKSTQTEYMWNGNPTVWASTAPVLFPIIGCLKDGKTYYKNQELHIPKHGFIRHNEELIIRQKTSDCINFMIDSTIISKEVYPFDFSFTIQFKLVQNRLEVQHIVENLSNSSPLFFSIGGHPAFKCPFNTNEHYSDYYLEFEYPETDDRWLVTKDGLIENEKTPFLKNQIHLSLNHKMFNEDALIFKNLLSKRISLKSKLSKQAIHVNFKDFEYIGIWAKPNSDFICIEPWNGISDSINTKQELKEKEGIIALNPGLNAKFCYSITIEE